MSRPNFVFIMTDTQATNVIGAYGDMNHRKGMDLHTPNIDRLADTGIKFERAYTTCPLCTPARAGIFTGIYAHTAGAWTNNLPLGDNIITMGQRFQDAGYHTGYIGKWHLDGHDYFGTGLCPDGWDPDVWFDGKRYLDELTETEITLWRRGLNSLEDLREHDIQAEFTWAHRISDRAERFLSGHDDRPFVLVVSYDEPHHPFTCPPEYVEMFEDFDYPLGPAAFDALEGKPAHQQEWATSANVGPPNAEGTVRLPMYLGANSFVDFEIGRVIDAVHRYAPENTWIIYTSDHGDMMGAHRLTGKGPVMYEEIAHIPLIVEPPPGSAYDGAAREPVASTVSHIDLLPTMMELAGMEVPPILEGESLSPLLMGDEQPSRSAVIEFQRYEIEHDSWGGFQPVRAITQGRYKLVINLLHTDELYDMHADPGEVVNRIADPELAEIRDELHDRLLTWMYAKRDPFRGPVWERRPWRESRRLTWRGEFRPRPADGYAPEVRDYDTGLPTEGVKTEYGK
ncbi:MAG: sulfatase-like hydrolase/transferase [Anaerolineae bacterium]|nr:sulfatase-like hydrolase/transferase [Anaerolineae bacterium]